MLTHNIFFQLKEKLPWAHFDARAFNLPNGSEVLVSKRIIFMRIDCVDLLTLSMQRNIIWRQADAKANSKLNLAHHYFSQRDLHGLKPKQVCDASSLYCGWNTCTLSSNIFFFSRSCFLFAASGKAQSRERHFVDGPAPRLQTWLRHALCHACAVRKN